MSICNVKTTREGGCGKNQQVWTRRTCELSVEVDSTGQVAVQTTDKMKQNFFAVPWDGGLFPTHDSCAPLPTKSSNCKCNASSLAVFDEGYKTPSLCGLKCATTSGCESFAVWLTGSVSIAVYSTQGGFRGCLAGQTLEGSFSDGRTEYRVIFGNWRRKGGREE